MIYKLVGHFAEIFWTTPSRSNALNIDKNNDPVMQAGGSNNSKSGKVSIVIPVYNGEKYLTECIESALNQTYEDTEIIAVNDGSTDGSSEILKRYSDRIKTIDTKNGGVAAACNRGIDSMTGEWLTILDSDDIMYPDAVEQMVRACQMLNSSSSTKIIPFFDLQLLNHDGRPTGRTIAYDMDNSMDAFEQGASIYHGFFGNKGVRLMHRSILKEVGGFDEGHRRLEDVEFNMRLIIVYKYRFHHIPKITYGYRMHGGQTTHNVEERRKMRERIIASVLSSLDSDDRERYYGALNSIAGRRAALIRAYRRAYGIVYSFTHKTHKSILARIAAKTLRSLSRNSLVSGATRMLEYRMRTVKVKPRLE